MEKTIQRKSKELYKKPHREPNQTIRIGDYIASTQGIKSEKGIKHSEGSLESGKR